MNFENEVERVAREYLREGYRVVRRPSATELPAFASGFGADLLATRGDENVLVEIKSSRRALALDPNVARAAEITNRQPGWRYDVIVLEHDPLPRLTEYREPTVEQIVAMLGEAEHALAMGAPRAAFIVSWAGLEAAMRRLGQHAGVGGRPGTQVATLIRELYSSGRLSPEELRGLDESRRLRSEIVHGMAQPPIDDRMVRSNLEQARRMLAESDAAEPATVES